MVVGYRFSAKDRLIRRAILGVPFDAKVKGFVDRSEKEFDKLAISNQNLSGSWLPYKLDPAPAQWYPDGDERNEESDPSQSPYLGEMKMTSPVEAKTIHAGKPPTSSGRTPASVVLPAAPSEPKSVSR